MTLNEMLLVVAAILGLVSVSRIGIRIRTRYVGMGVPCAVLATVLVTFVVTRKYSHAVLAHAQGDHHWAHNEHVRVVLVLALMAVAGLWMYIWYMSRNKD